MHTFFNIRLWLNMMDLDSRIASNFTSKATVEIFKITRPKLSFQFLPHSIQPDRGIALDGEIIYVIARQLQLARSHWLVTYTNNGQLQYS